MGTDGYDDARSGKLTSLSKIVTRSMRWLAVSRYNPGQFWRWSLPRLNRSSDEAKVKLNSLSNPRDYDYNPESQLHCNLATTAINNWDDDEFVNGASNLHRGRLPCLHDQILLTYRNPPRGSLPRFNEQSTEICIKKWTKILLKLPIKRNQKVNRIVTKEDFEW